jgi:hypothetical protein
MVNEKLVIAAFQNLYEPIRPIGIKPSLIDLLISKIDLIGLKCCSAMTNSKESEPFSGPEGTRFGSFTVAPARSSLNPFRRVSLASDVELLNEAEVA